MGKVIVWCNIAHTQLCNVLQGDVYVDAHVSLITAIADGEYTISANGLIVAVGNDVLAHLQQAKIVPKNLTMATLRERQYTIADVPVLLMYDPAEYTVDYAKYVETRCDIKDIARFKQHGYLSQPFENYAWVDNFDDFFTSYKNDADANIIAIDTETVGQFPYNTSASIICISFAWANQCSRAIYTHGTGLNAYAKQQLYTLLNDPNIKVRAANGKYDLQWIQEVWGIPCTNYNFDSLLGGNLVNENRSNSLSLHARVYTPHSNYDLPFNAEFDKSQMDKVPKDKLLYYACGDAQTCYLSTLAITKELQQLHKQIKAHKKQYATQYPYWQRVYGTPATLYKSIVHPASTTFQHIEQTGVCVDPVALAELRKDLVEEIATAKEQALDFLPQSIKAKYADNLSPTRSALLAEFVYNYLNVAPQKFTEKKHLPSTAIKDLLDLAPLVPEDVQPFFAFVQQYSKLSKTLSTFVDGFAKYICDDGKLHPTYFMFKGGNDFHLDGGTLSGRTSTKAPSFHVLPKHTADAKRLRRCYVAPPGYKIIQGDFATVELRLAAWASGDETMLQAFRQGLDLHKVTACSAHNITMAEFLQFPKDKQGTLRQAAKSANFGLVYKMWWKGYKDYAKKAYGVILSDEEAYNYYKTYHATYQKIQHMHEMYIAFARKFGYTIAPLGRVHNLPYINSANKELRAKSERIAINRPIQGLASDLMFLLLNLIHANFPQVQLFGTVHDSVLMYAPEHDANTIAMQIKHTAEHLPLLEMFNFPLLDIVPIVLDVEVGYNYADLKPVEQV